ncbi:transposase family protein [Streptomyces sp. NPDC087903]|uniref:helix-turn-helix domain-containing protein n=1 Tax=Streptomyces sp. NPDC087903 TaxID=3365819 RepID=UPI0037FD49F9
MSHSAFTGISRAHLGALIAELAGPWTARCESALHERRGGQRKQQPGAGPKHDLVFTDRVLVALVHLRTQLPHAALAELYGRERSTITRAVGEIRPLLAERGFAVPGRPGVRLRTLADVFAYAQAEGVKLDDDRVECTRRHRGPVVGTGRSTNQVTEASRRPDTPDTSSRPWATSRRRTGPAARVRRVERVQRVQRVPTRIRPAARSGSVCHTTGPNPGHPRHVGLEIVGHAEHGGIVRRVDDDVQRRTVLDEGEVTAVWCDGGFGRGERGRDQWNHPDGGHSAQERLAGQRRLGHEALSFRGAGTGRARACWKALSSHPRSGP